MSATVKPALHDVVVVDFSELLPGPFLTQMLVDMGAKVVKVERPPHGDPVRHSSPGLFAAINRNKESIQIDLKSDEGHKQALELLKTADVLVESFRPGTLARLGLSYDAVRAINPGIIYVSLSGYGQTGPDAMLPGHDLNYMAAAGVVALTGGRDQAQNPHAMLDEVPGSQSALPFADLGGSLYGLSALLAALYQRKTSGQGQWLDVSLTEAVLHQMGVRLAVFEQNRLEDVKSQRQSLIRPAYGCFECANGEFVTLGALETHFFTRLVAALEMTEFAAEIWKDGSHRKRHADDINAALTRKFLTMSLDEVVTLLRAHDVPVMAVIEPGKLSEHPQHAARQVFEQTDRGPLPRFPVRLSAMDPEP